MSLLVMFNHLLFVNTFTARSLPLTPCRLSFWRINCENVPLPFSSLWTVPVEPRARQGRPGRAGTRGTAVCSPDGAFSTGQGSCRLQRSLAEQVSDRHHCRGCAYTGMGQRMLLGAQDDARSSGEQVSEASLGGERLQGRERRQE